MDNTDSNIVMIKTRSEFQDYIDKNKYCIVKVGAKWCGPCKRVQPLIDKCFSKLKHVKLILVDADECIDLYSKLKVKSMPTIYTFVNGEMQNAQVGANELGISNLFLNMAKKVFEDKNNEYLQ
tara:strand:- start:521 stop:889 length:369 start_codon:yes stop_codon:yes gene_type:complete